MLTGRYSILRLFPPGNIFGNNIILLETELRLLATDAQLYECNYRSFDKSMVSF